jgi:hypothetical protein
MPYDLNLWSPHPRHQWFVFGVGGIRSQVLIQGQEILPAELIVCVTFDCRSAL